MERSNRKSLRSRRRDGSYSHRVRRLLDAPQGLDTWQQIVAGILIALMLFVAIAFGLMGVDHLFATMTP